MRILLVVFGNPVVHSAFQKDRGDVRVALSLSAVLKMQIDCRRPLGFIFLVYADVVAVACEARSGSAFDLNPSVVFYDVVFAEFGLVHHDLQLVMAFAAPHGNLDEQVMVLVSDVRDFDIVSAEFLRNFVLPVDAVFKESAAFDFPAVVDAATGSKACGNEWNENFKSRVHFI